MLHDNLISVDDKIKSCIGLGYSLSQTICEVTQWQKDQGFGFSDEDIIGQVDLFWKRDSSIASLDQRPFLNENKMPVPFEGHNPPVLPDDSVPGIIGDFARALAQSIQVPFELALTNTLGAYAIAGQRKFKVQVNPAYLEPLCLYAMCALPPGERKSSTVEACKRPLVEWQKAKQAEMKDKIKTLSSERQTLEEAIQLARKKAARAKTVESRKEEIERIKTLEAELPSIPAMPMLLADDFTPEALGALMADQDQRIGVMEAEGGLFDTLAGRYSAGVPNLDAVLKFWSGESAQIDRRGRDTICLDDPHLTLVICPQPEIIQGMASKPGFRERGLIGRFLYFLPKSKLGSRVAKSIPIPIEIEQRFNYSIKNILAIPWAKTGTNEDTSYVLQLTPEARTKWESMFDSIESQLDVGGDYEYMRDWAGKFPGQIVRLAGILHISMFENPQDYEISAETMETAIRLGNVLVEHAKAVFSLMGTDKTIECAKDILNWIKRDHVASFFSRDALNKVKGKFDTMSQVTPALKELEERSYIFALAGTNQGPGRPKSQEYMVNPLTFERWQ